MLTSQELQQIHRLIASEKEDNLALAVSILEGQESVDNETLQVLFWGSIKYPRYKKAWIDVGAFDILRKYLDEETLRHWSNGGHIFDIMDYGVWDDYLYGAELEREKQVFRERLQDFLQIKDGFEIALSYNPQVYAGLYFKLGVIAWGMYALPEARFLLGGLYRNTTDDTFTKRPECLCYLGEIQQWAYENPIAAQSYYEEFLQQYPNHQADNDFVIQPYYFPRSRYYPSASLVWEHLGDIQREHYQQDKIAISFYQNAIHLAPNTYRSPFQKKAELLRGDNLLESLSPNELQILEKLYKQKLQAADNLLIEAKSTSRSLVFREGNYTTYFHPSATVPSHRYSNEATNSYFYQHRFRKELLGYYQTCYAIRKTLYMSNTIDIVYCSRKQCLFTLIQMLGINPHGIINMTLMKLVWQLMNNTKALLFMSDYEVLIQQFLEAKMKMDMADACFRLAEQMEDEWEQMDVALQWYSLLYS